MSEDESAAPLKTTTLKVPLDKLKLDPENVRFAHLDKKLDDKKMDELIWKEKDTASLYEQIKAAKGLYEQPIVTSNYIVKEGNRRLVCLRRLQEKAKAGELPGIGKNVFDPVPCKQIPDETSPLDVELYLASVHIRGKKTWPAFNRAKRISELHSIHKLSYDQLTKRLGMGKITIIRLVSVYEQTDRCRLKHPEDKEYHRKFSYFDELFKKRGLKDFTRKQENIDKFIEWVYEGKFSDHRDVRLLDRILADPDVFHIFETENSAEAIKLLEEKDPALKSREFRQITKTIKVLGSFSTKEFVKIVKDPYRIKILENLKEEIDSLLASIKEIDRKD